MQPITQIFDYVDQHFESMLEDLEALCACPSTAGNPQGLEGARREILRKMESLGLKPELHPIPEGNALISAAVEGKDSRTLLFYNHYDVVEPGDPGLWKSGDPYKMRRDDGKLYARGVSDNKGALCSRLHAVQAILAVNKTLPVKVKFLFEGDEETSSPSMFRFAMEHPEEFKELIRSDLCVWENGRNDAAGRPWIRLGVRGSVSFDLKVTTAATDVHGRMGAAVPSASWRLVKALATLKDDDGRITIDGFYDSICPTTQEDLQVLRDFPYEEELQKKRLGISQFLRGSTGEKLKQQIYLEPSLSICAIEAGEPHKGVRGIVPHKASARLSFYLVANQKPAEVEALLRTHLRQHGYADIEVERRGSSNTPVRTPVNIPFRRRACEAAKKVYAQPMVVELTQLGGGPAGVFREAWPELPIVGFGPANTTPNHHAPEENMNVEDYRKAIKYLIALFYSYADDQIIENGDEPKLC